MASSEAPDGSVRITSDGSTLTQQISAGDHHLVADEPTAAGGANQGPTPYQLVLAGLGACTSMTLTLYARRKQWPLTGVEVTLAHSRQHAADCASCDEQPAWIERIDRDIRLAGDLSAEQRARLLDIANKCPVHRSLESCIQIVTRVV